MNTNKINMELSEQVVSLELAKKMKELGFSQESLFWWFKDYYPDGYLESGEWRIVDRRIIYQRACLFSRKDEDTEIKDGDIISAYSTAELGEMLPSAMSLTRKTVENSWRYQDIEGNSLYADTEADARAKMLIYLAEQGLINPKDIKI